MSEKKSFVAYYSWWDVISRLDDHQKALVLQAMFSTGDVCEKPELDLVSDVAFIPIEREIRANAEKWEETREKRREAGRKGGKASRKTAKNEEQANEAIAYFAKQDQAMLSNTKQSQANQAVDVDVDVDVDEVNIKEMSPTNVDDRAIDDEKAKERAKKAQETIKAKEHFEKLWALYPAKKGKNLISDKRKRDLLSVSVEEMERFIKRYQGEIENDHKNGFPRQWLNGSTWFNGRWQDYSDDDYQPVPKIKAVGKGKEYRYMSNEENRDFSHLEE